MLRQGLPLAQRVVSLTVLGRDCRIWPLLLRLLLLVGVREHIGLLLQLLRVVALQVVQEGALGVRLVELGRR